MKQNFKAEKFPQKQFNRVTDVNDLEPATAPPMSNNAATTFRIKISRKLSNKKHFPRDTFFKVNRQGFLNLL